MPPFRPLPGATKKCNIWFEIDKPGFYDPKKDSGEYWLRFNIVEIPVTDENRVLC